MSACGPGRKARARQPPSGEVQRAAMIPARAPSSAPSPSAATSAPSHSGPTRSTSRAKTGSMCW